MKSSKESFRLALLPVQIGTTATDRSPSTYVQRKCHSWFSRSVKEGTSDQRETTVCFHQDKACFVRCAQRNYTV